jgi:hypothetical protein
MQIVRVKDRVAAAIDVVDQEPSLTDEVVVIFVETCSKALAEMVNFHHRFLSLFIVVKEPLHRPMGSAIEPEDAAKRLVK